MPELGLAAREPNLDSACALSVERVRVRGPTLTGACAAFQPNDTAVTGPNDDDDEDDDDDDDGDDNDDDDAPAATAACDATCGVERAHFTTSASSEHRLPYWFSPRAAAGGGGGDLATPSAAVASVVLVMHGGARNGHEYLCFMQNALHGYEE